MSNHSSMELSTNVVNPLETLIDPTGKSSTANATATATATPSTAAKANGPTDRPRSNSRPTDRPRSNSRTTRPRKNSITLATPEETKIAEAQPKTTLRLLRASETATFSFSCYFTGFFRLLYAYAFFQAFLFGFAISVSIVLNSSFVSTRSLYWHDTIGDSVLWIFLTPLVNLVFAWLLDEALDVLLDTVSHSPWFSLDPLVVNERQKFVYLSTGGSRPVLLNLRANATALLCAAFVWPPKESKLETQEKAIAKALGLEGEGGGGDSTTTTNTNTTGEQKGEEAVTGLSGQKKNKKNKKTKKTTKQTTTTTTNTSTVRDGDIMDEDPLFVPPDWTVLVVEVFFWCSFVLFPLLFAANRGGAYQFQSLNEGFLVSVFIVALITCPLYAALHLAVYLWPRAARIDAFIRGQSVAEFAWPPYYTDLSTKSVIGPPLEKGGEAERMERKANFSRDLTV